MSLQIKRPKGVTVFVILGFLDAIAMAGFIVMFFGSPEMYVSLFDVEAGPDFGQEYALLQFNERVLEFGIFVIIVDVLGIIGLLSARPLGRKLAMGCATAGIVFNVIIFGIPGLVANSILLWYLYGKYTKEYFANKEILE